MYLPLYNGDYSMFTYFVRLTKYLRLIPCFVMEGALSFSSVAKLFFKNIVRLLGIPAEMISNRDPRFIAFFW